MNVYKLKNGKKVGAFQLAIKNQMVAKMVNGEKVLKKVHYIPGSDSIFVEDYKGDEKSKAVWFDDGELRVSPENKVLNELVQSLDGYNKHYYLVNEEKEAEKEVNDFEILTKASNSIINEKDEHKLQAMAMIIISLDAVSWPAMKCKSELLKYAKNHSKILLAEMAKPDYEAKHLAALAFAKGIVKHNEFQTAVLWADGDNGIIVRVAEGEKGVDKLGDLLSKTSEASTALMQRIGEKADALISVNEAEVVSPSKSEAEIRAEVKAEFEANMAPVKTEAEIRAEIMAEMAANTTSDTSETPVVTKPAKDTPSENAEVDELEALRKEYTTVTGKKLSPAYMNNAEWIKSKIAEANNS